MRFNTNNRIADAVERMAGGTNVWVMAKVGPKIHRPQDGTGDGQDNRQHRVAGGIEQSTAKGTAR